MSENKQVAVQQNQSFFPTPAEFSALKEQVQVYIDSKFLPAHIKTPEQALTIVLKGRELGIAPLQALAQIHVINGKPGMSAELMLALIYERCPGAKIEFKSSATSCVIFATRPGQKTAEFSFTEQDAIRAGLKAKGGVWNAYPGIMLRARCVSQMARAVFPDILGGASHTPEELGATIDSRGNIVEVASKAEVVNAPMVELEQRLPDDLPNYVVPIGNEIKGQKLKDVPNEKLHVVRAFLEKHGAGIAGGAEFRAVLDKYLGPVVEPVREPGEDMEGSTDELPADDRES